jgi:hypothetical protein
MDKAFCKHQAAMEGLKSMDERTVSGAVRVIRWLKVRQSKRNVSGMSADNRRG